MSLRIGLLGIGRMKAGPERILLDRYCDRARAIAKGVGIADVLGTEIDESRAADAAQRKREEGSWARAKLSDGATVMLLDERGRSLPSRDLAARIGRARDEGVPALCFIVGGPDGLDPDWVAHDRLSFGAATLPHQLVRVLVAEQIYRSLTILAGHPYHRD